MNVLLKYRNIHVINDSFSYILFGISKTFLHLSICFSTLEVHKSKNQFIQAEK